MLKLVRRPESDFLSPDHRRGLKNRVASAHELAGKGSLTAEVKSKRIRSQWKNFRAGRTSQGTFDALWIELRAMAFEKCALCETPAPDTVEHLDELSQEPAKAFDWNNLLAACATCNRTRENSGSTAEPLDPSSIEPLDYFGWDEYGTFAPAPEHETEVLRHVEMYGLERLKGERQKLVLTVRALLASTARNQPVRADTRRALRATLTGTGASLGPVREYLLRPPTDDDALIVEEALRRVPDTRTWVQPWLRPPPWAPAHWQ